MKHLKLPTLFLMVLPIAACGSLPETRYFVLARSPDGPAPQESGVRVASVTLPTYLRASGIALATAPYEIRHARYHRWAEPLDEGIERALQTALEKHAGDHAVEGDVTVVVAHFHGNVSGQVVLEATWHVQLADGQHRTGRFYGELPQEADGYAALVAAQATLVEGLSTDISTSLADASFADASQ